MFLHSDPKISRSDLTDIVQNLFFLKVISNVHVLCIKLVMFHISSNL